MRSLSLAEDIAAPLSFEAEQRRATENELEPLLSHEPAGEPEHRHLPALRQLQGIVTALPDAILGLD